ncbi:MAG: hypothetical protein QOE58_2876 [Actinomycetota bacterium]|nr:hypothetical protein [Actinomycetota bacterium]
MSILVKPRTPTGSEPSRDDDLTGVRALLSSLPEPDPMPDHLVKRINASLAAEQAQRTASMSETRVSALLPTARRRRPRLLLVAAGAAAAVALISIVGSDMLTTPGGTTTASRAGVARTSSAGEAESSAQAQGPAADKAAKAASGATPPLAIGVSGTRYTRADFVKQARTLQKAPLHSSSALLSGASYGPATSAPGLSQCLRAIGAAGADVVRADVALYEGRRAVIIVATTRGSSMAYAVGPACSPADAVVLHPGAPLS